MQFIVTERESLGLTPDAYEVEERAYNEVTAEEKALRERKTSAERQKENEHTNTV